MQTEEIIRYHYLTSDVGIVVYIMAENPDASLRPIKSNDSEGLTFKISILPEDVDIIREMIDEYKNGAIILVGKKYDNVRRILKNLYGIKS